MTAKVKFGLVVGVVGLVLNICVSALIGVCGPGVSILAGATAGFFTSQSEKATTRSRGARLGAISGAIAGVLVLIGQMIGGIGALLFFQVSGIPAFGVSLQDLDTANQVVSWTSGLGVSLCIGLIGITLSALGGAIVGYVNVPAPPTTEAAL